MDSASVIIGGIILAIMVVPFIIMNRNRKKKDKKMIQFLSGIAGQHGANIGQHEIFGNFIIGVDDDKKNVFFFKKKKDGESTEQAINLSGIQQCKVAHTNKSMQGKEGNYQVTDRLDLSFVPKDKSQSVPRLELFNAEDSLQLNGELQVAEKWAKIINEGLKKKK